MNPKEGPFFDVNSIAYMVVLRAIEEFKGNSRKILKRLQKIFSSSKPRYEHVFCSILLQKNLHTSNAVHALLRKGDIEEAFVLMRLIMERTALAFTILRKGLNLDEITKLKNEKCILALKKTFFGVERQYGMFSKIAHVDPLWFARFYFLFSSRKRSRIADRGKMQLDVPFVYVSLCIVNEITLAVVDFLAQKYIVNVKSWRLDNNRHWQYTPIRSLLKKGATGLFSMDIFYALIDPKTRITSERLVELYKGRKLRM